MPKQSTTDIPTISAGGETTRSVWQWLNWIGDLFPTAAVLLLLAAVAYFGHRYDWKMPKFSTLSNGGVAADEPDWCPEHGVLESQCVECLTKRKLLPQPADFGWCKLHG